MCVPVSGVFFSVGVCVCDLLIFLYTGVRNGVTLNPSITLYSILHTSLSCAVTATGSAQKSFSAIPSRPGILSPSGVMHIYMYSIYITQRCPVYLSDSALELPVHKTTKL